MCVDLKFGCLLDNENILKKKNKPALQPARRPFPMQLHDTQNLPIQQNHCEHWIVHDANHLTVAMCKANWRKVSYNNLMTMVFVKLCPGLPNIKDSTLIICKGTYFTKKTRDQENIYIGLCWPDVPYYTDWNNFDLQRTRYQSHLHFSCPEQL